MREPGADAQAIEMGANDFDALCSLGVLGMSAYMAQRTRMEDETEAAHGYDCSVRSERRRTMRRYVQ